MGKLPVSYVFPDLELVIDALMQELDEFDKYFAASAITAVHSGFGTLNHKEWLIWHGKHFTHHLKQFRLLPLAL